MIGISEHLAERIVAAHREYEAIRKRRNKFYAITYGREEYCVSITSSYGRFEHVTLDDKCVQQFIRTLEENALARLNTLQMEAQHAFESDRVKHEQEAQP